MTFSQYDEASPARDTTIFFTFSSGTPWSLSDGRIPSEAKTSISPFWTEKWATEGVDEAKIGEP